MLPALPMKSRAVVLEHEKVNIGPRFDEIDQQLSLAMSHVQTDADWAVYYALAYANNSLTVAPYSPITPSGATMCRIGTLHTVAENW